MLLGIIRNIPRGSRLRRFLGWLLSSGLRCKCRGGKLRRARHGNDCLWIVAQYLFGEAFDYDFAGKGSGRPWQAAELSNTRVPVGCESAFFWSS
jgi:hypothetical protein